MGKEHPIRVIQMRARHVDLHRAPHLGAGRVNGGQLRGRKLGLNAGQTATQCEQRQ
jgi:hypothetical protein